MKLSTKLKVFFPYALSSIRIILSPFIILLSFINHPIFALILAIICLLSDLLDDYIADKWYVKTEKCLKFDMASDKVFEICGICSLLKTYPYFVLLLLEILLITLNTYRFYKVQKDDYVKLGKAKSIILWIFLFQALINQCFSHLFFIVNGLYMVCINIFIIYLINLGITLKQELEEASLSELEKSQIHKELMQEKTQEVKNLKDFINNGY